MEHPPSAQPKIIGQECHYTREVYSINLGNMNIKDRIYKAINDFVLSHSTEQSTICLSEYDYKELHSEAESTALGRSFLVGDYGTDMKFCNLDVRIHNEDFILVY